MEFVRLGFDALHLVFGQFHQSIDGVFEALGTLGTPLQPQFEDVIVAAALDDLIACIVADVVQFVGHEQIFGRHLIAAQQETLFLTKLNTHIERYKLHGRTK